MFKEEGALRVTRAVAKLTLYVPPDSNRRAVAAQLLRDSGPEKPPVLRSIRALESTALGANRLERRHEIAN